MDEKFPQLARVHRAELKNAPLSQENTEGENEFPEQSGPYFAQWLDARSLSKQQAGKAVVHLNTFFRRGLTRNQFVSEIDGDNRYRDQTRILSYIHRTGLNHLRLLESVFFPPQLEKE